MERALKHAYDQLLLAWKNYALQLLDLNLEDIPALVENFKLLQKLGADVEKFPQTLWVVRNFLEELFNG